MKLLSAMSLAAAFFAFSAAFYAGFLNEENRGLQTLLNAHTGCMPEHEGEIPAVARKVQIVECSITDGSGGRRHVVSRFSYEI